MNNSAYQRLNADSKVMLDPDACLELRPAPSDCAKCRTACPVSAFEWTESGVSVSDRCLGCGQCASVCPTGALKVHGFAIDAAALLSTTGTIRIECARVPESIRRGAIRVPCLAGLSADQLLGIRAAGGARPLTLIDRGWCAECAAGSTGCNASRAIEETAATLEALECDESLWPRIERVDTPVAFALPIENAYDSEPLGRRAFFGALVKGMALAAQAAPLERVTAGPHARLPSPTIRSRRQRFANNVRRVAAEAGVRVPAVIFPQVEVASGCDNHGLCAAVCPSAALRMYNDGDGATGLEFEPELCIACEACAEHCPSQAIRVRPTGDTRHELPDAPIRLTRFARQQCSRCAESFVGQTGESECGSCKKDRALFGSLLPVFSRTRNFSAEQQRN